MALRIRELGRAFWSDESGAVVSAELAMVATLGVVGTTVGIDTLSKSVNEELSDFAFAIRSFDQSYSVKRRESAGAHVAASRFEQLDVKTAHEQLRQHKTDAETRQQKQLDALKKERAAAEHSKQALAL